MSIKILNPMILTFAFIFLELETEWKSCTEKPLSFMDRSLCTLWFKRSLMSLGISALSWMKVLVWHLHNTYCCHTFRILLTN